MKNTGTFLNSSIFAAIQSRQHHIAFFLLLLFGVTQVPFHVFHAHEEELHHLAHVSHDETHFCELDKNACPLNPEEACGHPAHIGKTHPKCFTCQFHFIKHFDVPKTIEQDILVRQNIFKGTSVCCATSRWARQISNKGPPSII